jgi:L-2-hydroxyglutarate oxidase LhgO
MDKIDIAIIGAGTIGLAIAMEIADGQKNIFVLEKEPDFGKHTSSRNSEVIHAGIYYRPGSLKANLCIEGNALLYEICERNNIAYKRIAKIIVATSEGQIGDLYRLYKNAKDSGVKGLEMVNEVQILKMEPNVHAAAGIFSPNTGIFDTHAYMKHLIAETKASGAQISYNSEVTGIKKMAEGYQITVLDADKQNFSFIADVIINSAGLFSDKVAQMAGIDIKKEGYDLKYCKGQYFRVSGKSQKLVSRLVYPVPRPRGHSLGIHAGLDLVGNLRFGPDEHYMKENKIDYDVDESQKQAFFDSVSRYLPIVKLEDFYPDTAGIRPKLQGPDDDFRDFVIKEEKDLGLEGFINLIGIESPGLTAAPAIAKMVKGMLR